MIELFPNIFYIPGKDNSQYPCCACSYLKGQNMRVLIDAGMGADHLAPIKKGGLDIMILTRCHLDQCITDSEIPNVQVWCHELEVPFINDKNQSPRFSGLNAMVRTGPH